MVLEVGRGTPKLAKFQPGWATPVYGSMGIALIKAVRQMG